MNERDPRFLFRTVVLGAAVLLIFTASTNSLRSHSDRRSGEIVRLAIETQIEARQLYWMEHFTGLSAGSPDLTKQRTALIANLKKLVDLTNSPRAIRRLALLQHAAGVSEWKATLLRLRSAPNAGSTSQIERELDLWRDALGDSPTKPERVAEIKAGIARMEMGWFQHMAMEAVYRRAGMEGQAEKEVSAADRSLIAITIIILLGLLFAFAGVILGGGLVILFIAKRIDPDRRLPAFLQPAPPPVLTLVHIDALYLVFIAYILAYTGIHFLGSLLLPRLLGDRLARAESAASMIVSLAMLAAWLIVPYLVYRRQAAHTGLKAADIGFRSRNIPIDIAWGVAGYSVLLPLVWLAALASQFIFRGIETPLNPAITEFAGNRSLFIQLFLFTEAAVLAPVMEEVFFRGIFFTAIRPRIGSWGAVLISSGTFALLHPQLPLGFLSIFVLGAGFNLLYIFRGSLVPSITAHAINNGAILLLLTLLFGG